MTTTLDLARHLLLFAILVFALYTDLAQERVDNLCSYGGIVLGLLLQGLAGGWGGGLRHSLDHPKAPGLASALMGGGLAFLLFLPFVLKGKFGAGDLKLMTAVGALLGLGVTLTALVGVTATGAVMGLVVLAWKGRGKSFRYVPAIAAGTTGAWWIHYV